MSTIVDTISLIGGHKLVSTILALVLTNFSVAIEKLVGIIALAIYPIGGEKLVETKSKIVLTNFSPPEAP